jgi:phosphoenolpyruvate carboxykinase (ATP)
MVYAKLLADKLDRHGARVFLIDTGWLWGPYGVGRRIPIELTRNMVTAALEGRLDSVEYRHDMLLNLDVPVDCCGVPKDMLVPRDTWKDKEAYDAAATRLARMFSENFKRFRDVPQNVVEAGPKVLAH